MQKVLLTIFFVGFSLSTMAQQQLPTISANSEKVDIRVGDDYFSKGGWILEPAKNPDIFSIGSKWHYESKRVTFITDIDSISFNVQPGNTYNFIILKENIPCHIQILTFHDPVFLHNKTLISLLAGFSVFVLLLYFNRKKINARLFLQSGYWLTILFWAMTIVSGYNHGNYNHLKNTISELGAIGTKSEFFTSVFLMLLAVLNILFCIGFYKASKAMQLNLLPSILSFAMPVTMIWAGIFTLGNEFHSSTGVLPFLIIIGSILSYFLWKKNYNLQQLRTTSLISFVIMMLILTRFIKPFGIEFEGLVQRFFYLGWTVWTVGISYFLTKHIRFPSR
ncbi:MAG: DUF998 domain-containing protein [Ferruginibacter sp.]